MFKKIRFLARPGHSKDELFHKHQHDAGWDLKLPAGYEFNPCDTAPIIDFGVRVHIPAGYCALLCPRSSFTLAGGSLALGVIDAEYVGSIKGKFYNLPEQFKAGDRVAQLVFLPCAGLPVQSAPVLRISGRGMAGIGSTGRQ